MNRETPKPARPRLLVALGVVAVLAVVLTALLISWDEEPGPPESQPELGPLSLSKRVWAADGVTLFRNGGTVRLRDGRLLVATDDGIKLLDVESGAALWAQDNDAELPGETVAMDPTASQRLPFVVRHGDGVLVGYDVVRCDLVEPGVALLSGETGDVVWQAPTTPAEGCAQNKVDWKQNLWAADDTTALVSVAPDGGNPDDLEQVRVLALDVATGKQKWEYEGVWPQAIAGGVALVSTVKPIPLRVTGSGMVTALDLATGQPKWSVAERYAEVHLVQTIGDVVVVATNDKSGENAAVRVLDAATGREIATLPDAEPESCVADVTLVACPADSPKLVTYRLVDRAVKTVPVEEHTRLLSVVQGRISV